VRQREGEEKGVERNKERGIYIRPMIKNFTAGSRYLSKKDAVAQVQKGKERRHARKRESSEKGRVFVGLGSGKPARNSPQGKDLRARKWKRRDECGWKPRERRPRAKHRQSVKSHVITQNFVTKHVVGGRKNRGQSSRYEVTMR